MALEGSKQYGVKPDDPSGVVVESDPDPPSAGGPPSSDAGGNITK